MMMMDDLYANNARSGPSTCHLRRRRLPLRLARDGGGIVLMPWTQPRPALPTQRRGVTRWSSSPRLSVTRRSRHWCADCENDRGRLSASRRIGCAGMRLRRADGKFPTAVSGDLTPAGRAATRPRSRDRRRRPLALCNIRTRTSVNSTSSKQGWQTASPVWACDDPARRPIQKPCGSWSRPRAPAGLHPSPPRRTPGGDHGRRRRG